MTDAERKRRSIRAATPPRGRARAGEITSRALSLPVYLVQRIVRSVSFRARYGPQRIWNGVKRFSLLIKRRAVFPARNALRRNKALSVSVAGEQFLLAPEGIVAFDIFARRRFDARRELEFILPLLQPHMTFVDVGANVGVFSIPAAKRLRDGKVFAFEPSSWTYERLLRNIRLNGLTNIHATQSALGDQVGEASLQINVTGKDGLNTLGSATHVDCEIIGRELVPITTLDHFVSQNSASRVDVMKIDVEGAELFVLRGAEDLLGRLDAPMILYEGGFLSKGFDYHPVEQMWLLEKYGYSFFLLDSITGRISKPFNQRAYDSIVVAVKPSHPAYVGVKEQAR
jgi:FkbM family methyltransferase